MSVCLSGCLFICLYLYRAAFQYGVKMNAGRKTRRFGKGGEKDDKAKLDREWKQISNVSLLFLLGGRIILPLSLYTVIINCIKWHQC